jgi:Fe-S oxidoreductase
VLDRAVAMADGALDRVSGWMHDGSVRAFLFCEPSCLSAVKDDWPALRLRTAPAARQQLAAQSWLVEEFLEREWERHPGRPVLDGGLTSGDREAGSVLLHAHCHQKALWGADSSANLLRRFVGERLTVLDSGCCGMAGAFGFTADHHDLSMKIGERSLFPAVRGAGASATILATGTSCRHQVRDGTGIRARHPVEAAAAWLDCTDVNATPPGPHHRH